MLASLALLPILAAAVAAQTCNISNPCGSDAPCCSEFSFCGADSIHCLGGCNPLYSHSLTSCEPNPICQDAVYTFADLKNVINGTAYNGNASLAGWTLDKGNAQITTTNDLALTLTQSNGGTRISSTHYVHYGTITARLKAGKWPGVVTAFIMMSDVKDEIDVEMPGDQVFQFQSNYFWEGVVTNPTHGGTHNVTTDNSANFHDYTIDWQPDHLSWLVDGQVVRTLQRTDTLDSSTGIYKYPTTPSRVQLSIWPAGINTSAPGTVTWAGGMINWQDPDYTAAGGQFFALVHSVNITCSSAIANPPGAHGYVYGANQSGVPTVLASNQSTIFGAAYAMVKVNFPSMALALLVAIAALVVL